MFNKLINKLMSEGVIAQKRQEDRGITLVFSHIEPAISFTNNTENIFLVRGDQDRENVFYSNEALSVIEKLS